MTLNSSFKLENLPGWIIPILQNRVEENEIHNNSYHKCLNAVVADRVAQPVIRFTNNTQD